MKGADLEWPGRDRERALQALWHLQRAAQPLVVTAARDLAGTWTAQAPRWQPLEATRIHLRIAFGSLAAVGYESSLRR